MKLADLESRVLEDLRSRFRLLGFKVQGAGLTTVGSALPTIRAPCLESRVCGLVAEGLGFRVSASPLFLTVFDLSYDFGPLHFGFIFPVHRRCEVLNQLSASLPPVSLRSTGSVPSELGGCPKILV